MQTATTSGTHFNVAFPPINIKDLTEAVQQFAENLSDAMDSVGCSKLVLNNGDTLRLDYMSTFSGSYRTLTLNDLGNLEDGVSLDLDAEYCPHGDPHHRIRPAEFQSGIDFLMGRRDWIEALQNYCSSRNELIAEAIGA